MGSKVRFRLAPSWLAPLALLIAGEASGGYHLTDLGVLAPGSSTVGNAINNSGAVAGTLTSAGNATTAETSAGPGGFTSLTLNPIKNVGSTTATGINAGGQVTGSFVDPVDGRTHAYRSVSGVASDLGTLDYRPAGASLAVQGRETLSSGINASGQVVGTVNLVDGTSRAFRGDSGGALSFLPSIGDGQSSQGGGINAGGQVVGTYELYPGADHAFYTDKGGNPVDLLKSYTAPGFGLNTHGTAINDGGALVGYGDFGQNSSHAFLAPAPAPGGAKTALIDLGVLAGYTSSYAYGVNSASQVVGKLDVRGAGAAAFVYDPTRGMIDLRSLLTQTEQLHWTSLILATGINDGLQITGEGIVDGQDHAFLLTPIPGQDPFAVPSAVPTPPAVALSAPGLAIASAFARLRRGRIGGPGAA